MFNKEWAPPEKMRKGEYPRKKEEEPEKEEAKEKSIFDQADKKEEAIGEGSLPKPENYENWEQVNGVFNIHDEKGEYLLMAEAQARVDGDEIKWFDSDLEYEEIHLSEDDFGPVIELFKKAGIDFTKENYQAETGEDYRQVTGDSAAGSIWVDQNELNKALQDERIIIKKEKGNFFNVFVAEDKE